MRKQHGGDVDETFVVDLPRVAQAHLLVEAIQVRIHISHGEVSQRACALVPETMRSF